MIDGKKDSAAYLQNRGAAVRLNILVTIIQCSSRHSLHPLLLAGCRQLTRVEVDVKPLLVLLEVAGFPITTMKRGIPLAAIWKTAEFGQVLEDLVKRLLQVAYSEVPSVDSIS